MTCNSKTFFLAGAGGRYRKFITKKLYWEVNVMGVVTETNDSEDKKTDIDPMPYANIGLGYDFGKTLVTYSVSYAPKGAGNAITSDSSLLFMNISIAF